MELASLEDYHPPAGAVVGHVLTPDNVNIRYALWKAASAPYKGTVVLLQGRAEHLEKHFETVADLVRHGFDVCAFDFRGQGGSDRLVKDARRGYIDSFSQYVTDLDTILKQVVLPDCRPPYYILGHSMGSLVALLASPELGNRIRRMVLCSPLIRFGTVPIGQGMARFVSGFLSVIGLGQVYLSGKPNLKERRRYTGNPLTSDFERFERQVDMASKNPELTISGPTAAWVFAACQAMEHVTDPDFIGQIHIPTLLVAAGLDRVVSNTAIEMLGRAMRSGRTITIDGARHELWHERDVYRQQLLAAFNAFIPGTD